MLLFNILHNCILLQSVTTNSVLFHSAKDAFVSQVYYLTENDIFSPVKLIL